jgi:hypothetical protein
LTANVTYLVGRVAEHTTQIFLGYLQAVEILLLLENLGSLLFKGLPIAFNDSTSAQIREISIVIP